MSLRGTLYMLPESDSWLKECLLAGRDGQNRQLLNPLQLLQKELL